MNGLLAIYLRLLDSDLGFDRLAVIPVLWCPLFY
jgi:hypothetical protein